MPVKITHRPGLHRFTMEPTSTSGRRDDWHQIVHLVEPYARVRWNNRHNWRVRRNPDYTTRSKEVSRFQFRPGPSMLAITCKAAMGASYACESMQWADFPNSIVDDVEVCIKHVSGACR